MKRKKTDGLNGCYALVAGKVDRSENPSIAMIRETYEEAGITIHPEDLKLVSILHRAHTDYLGKTEDIIELVFTTENWEGAITNREPDLCSELAFFPVNDLPPETTDTVRRALHCYNEKIPYVEI